MPAYCANKLITGHFAVTYKEYLAHSVYQEVNT